MGILKRAWDEASVSYTIEFIENGVFTIARNFLRMAGLSVQTRRSSGVRIAVMVMPAPGHQRLSGNFDLGL